MLWKPTTVNIILKAWKTMYFFNALYFADGMRLLPSILPMKSSTNATNLLLLPFLNAGRARRGELVSFPDPSNWWYELYRTFYQLSSSTFTYRWWCGNYPQATFVKLVHLSKAMKGSFWVVPVMKLFEDSFSYSNQLGQRQGAGVVYLNVFTQILSPSFQLRKKTPMKKSSCKDPFTWCCGTR